MSNKKIWVLLIVVMIGFVSCDNSICNVTFDLGYNNLTFTNSVKNGDKIVPPEDSIREAYIFKGWYSDKKFKNRWDFNNPVTKNIKLYAKWEKIEFTVNFDTDNGSSIEPQNINKGEKLIEPEQPSKEFFTFIAWYSDEDFNTRWNFNIDIVEENMTLYAKWEAQIVVEFDSNGGSEVQTVYLDKNSLLEEPETPIKIHFTFKGWFKDDGFLDEWDFSTDTLTENITLYAKWEAQIVVEFDSNGGSEVGTVYIDKNSLLEEPENPIRIYFTFEGWFKDETFLEEWDFATDTLTENITLYAKWEREQVIVEFNTDGGSEVGTVCVDKGSLLEEPEMPTKIHFTFKGWFKDEGFLEEWDFATDIVIENITLYVKWEAQIVVNFNSNGGSEIETIYADKNSLLERPDDPTKDFFIFEGWSKYSFFFEEWDFATDILTENIELYAKWILEKEGDYVIVPFSKLEKYLNEFASETKLNYIKITELNASDVLGYGSSDENNITRKLKNSNKKVALKLSGNEELSSISGFKSLSKLIKIDLSSNIHISSIGNDTFKGCENLNSIILPASIESIGDTVFYNTAIREIDLSACSNFTSIGKDAFKECIKLKTVLLPASIESIGEGAFYNTKITRIDLSACSNLTNIGNYVFNTCYSLEEVLLPESIESIGERAFYKTAITQIDLSACSNLTSIGNFVFYSCRSLEEVLLPVSIESIGVGAFGESAIREIDLSACSNLTSIGNYVFDLCRSLEEVLLPASIESIGVAAFFMTAITEIDLSVCSNLSISDSVFSQCSSLEEVLLPASIESIGEGAFSRTAITHIDLSACSNLTSIGKGAFSSCKSLEEVLLPESIESIGDGAFWRTAIRHIDLSACSNLISIGKSVFSGCSSLEEVSLPASIENIGDKAFYCSGLKDIDLSACSNLTSIVAEVFYECNNLETVLLPESIENIGDKAFYCSGLKNIDLSACSNLTRIGDEVFRGCSSLETVLLPASIERIGRTAFYECSNLEEVILPIGIESIGHYAFNNGCNKVIVPNEDVKALVLASGYTGTIVIE